MNQVDPISGNAVPPGAAPEEVRDDVDAKLSTGEYVLSADVVRFLGVEKIENLVKKAQDAMKKIESGVGADTEIDEELDLPFDPSELQTEDEPVQMATGGLVHGGMVGDKDEPFNGLFNLPQTQTQQPVEEQSEAKPDDKLTGIAGKVQDWTPKDFDTYSRSISDPGHRAAESIISAIPGGKIGLNMRYDYLNTEVPKSINQMLSTGLDLQGNKLTAEQQASLKSVLDTQNKSGGIKANNSRIAAIADPVAKSLGLEKFTSPITKAKEAVTSPIKQFTNEHIRDPIKGAVQSAIKDPIKNTVESVKQGIREATGNTKAQKEERGLISRRDEEKDSKDKSKNNDKSDKGGKGEGDKSSSSKGSSKGSSSSGKSEKDDKDKK